jgi:hypothetical protein
MIRTHSALGILKFLMLCFLLQTNIVIVCSLTSDQTTTRRDWFRATAGALLSSNVLLLSDAANAAAAADAVEEGGRTTATTTTTKPYLMKEYYDNKPTTMPSKGRSFFPALTPPFKNRATYRYEVSLAVVCCLASDMATYLSLWRHSS